MSHIYLVFQLLKLKIKVIIVLMISDELPVICCQNNPYPGVFSHTVIIHTLFGTE